jgi:hypothetical protein
VPSGDPERFILVEYELYNSSDSLLFRQTHRIGEEWEWHPEARKMSDNNMYPGEERLFLFKKQSLFIGSYKLRVRVSKHRMSEDAAAYNKLGKEYPRSIEIWSKEYSFSVK